MSRIEVTLSDRLATEIEQLGQQDEFLDREDAIEELLSRGISTYSEDPATNDPDDGLFDQTVDDQQDPAMRNEGGGDGYSF